LAATIAACALSGAAGSAGAEDAGIAAAPFWKASAGWWLSDNTYFDPAMNYNIRAYNSLTHIEVEGRRVRETEYKFYAPSKLAQGYGRGQVSAEEGIEVVTITVAEATSANGGARFVQPTTGAPLADRSRIDVLSPDTAMRVVPGPGAVDEYRMVITLPAPNRRYIANFGIVSHPGDAHGAVGDLRGFSVFRASKVAAADFERLRDELRVKNKVAAVVATDAGGTAVVKRLD